MYLESLVNQDLCYIVSKLPSNPETVLLYLFIVEEFMPESGEAIFLMSHS